MRIAFLNVAADLGGAERMLLHLLSSLRAAAPAYELHLVTPGDGPLLARAAGLGVRTRVVPMPGALGRVGESHHRSRRGAWWGLARQAAALPAAARYAVTLRRALADIAPGLIHSNGIKTHLLAGVARPRRVPVVWHVHDFYGLRPVTARLLRVARRGTAGAVAISDAVARDARHVLPGVPVVTVLNAIDVGAFAEPADGPADLDCLAGLTPAAGGTTRVGLVATYALWKGQGVFLEAAARIVAARPDLPVRFFVVGGPIYQTQAQWSGPDLRGRAAALGLTERVGFVPFQADPARAYHALDVVVHASTRPEPFGLTIAEAMACGKPVVVSSAGGAAELFTDGVDAVGVPPSDAAALADAVTRLAADAGLRRRLGHAARRTAERRFDRGRLGPELLAAYRQLLDPRAGRGGPPAPTVGARAPAELAHHEEPVCGT
jgi:glycosyltransferase involved in cell wall biosynthesis